MGTREPGAGPESAAAIDPDAFRRAVGHLPTGVTVVTAPGADGPSGLTANAVSSLSLDPPLMLACLDRGSRTLRAVEAAGRFGVNVLAAGQEDLARAFATKREMHEKWDGVAWAERGGLPALEGTDSATIDAKQMQSAVDAAKAKAVGQLGPEDEASLLTLVPRPTSDSGRDGATDSARFGAGADVG